MVLTNQYVFYCSIIWATILNIFSILAEVVTQKALTIPEDLGSNPDITNFTQNIYLMLTV